MLRAPPKSLGGWEAASLTASANRKVQSSQTCEAFLADQDGGRYLVLPTAVNQLNKAIRPDYCLLMHSNQPIIVDKMEHIPSATVARAMYLMASTTTEKVKRSSLGVRGGSLLALGSAGTILVVENLSTTTISLRLSCKGENIVASRGTMNTEDAVPPMCFQIVNILTQAVENVGYSLQYSMTSRTVPVFFGAAAETHNPAVNPSSIHAVVRMGQ